LKQYHDLLEYILKNGQEVKDRTGVGTISVFGYQMRFNLQEGFPAITTKKLAWKSVVSELLWFLEGSTDERRLAELTYGKSRDDLIGKRTIWTDNADVQGKSLGHTNNDYCKELGHVYGYQWRNFDGHDTNVGTDQIKYLIKEMKENPDSRRLILSAWNPNQSASMALPPCHTLTQFRVYNGKLSCQLYIRSNDVFLGAPFNIASYALLTHILARECGISVGDLIYTIGDAHIYLNHIEQVREQLKREEYPLPELYIDDSFDLNYHLNYNFNLNSASLFTLKNYKHHDKIVAKMAV
jgi:thymidylate synthase